jgi:hypothetical protein
MPKPWIIGVVAFLCGAVTASGAWTAFPPQAPRAVARPEPSATSEPADADLQRANANLTASLQECDRRLAELGEHPVGVPTPAEPAAPDAGRRRRESRELTTADWEKMAEAGVVPVRIPCIREQAWTPNERAVNRLGLSPSDVDMLKQAYEASNKRMNEQIKPLCSQVLGSAQAADQAGTSACIDIIGNGARKSGADGKAALTRVAEVQAGKRSAPSGGDVLPVEQLGLILTKESKTFEDDLAQKLGPDDAKRLALAPELCTERKTLRAADADAPSQAGDARGNSEGGGRRNRNR